MRSRDEVLRFHIWGNREGDTEVEVRADGEWVRHDDYADRLRELEAQQVASEPVAWAVMLPTGEPMTFAASREGVSYWAQKPDFTIIPLYAHPIAAAVTEAYERGRLDAIMDLAASIPKYPTYYPDVNLGPDDVGEPAASEGASA